MYLHARPGCTSSHQRLRLFVVPAALVMTVHCAMAATYYVATTGSDSNPGNQAAPFRHLTKAASTATQPGDTVIVMDGTYDNEGVVAPNFVVTLYYSGTAGNPITFKAQNRGRAILDSMNTSATTTCNGASAYFDLKNASFIVIQGFVIQRGCDSGIQSNDAAHDIVIKWNEIRNIANHTVTDQIGRDGIYVNSSEYNFTFDGNSWHDIGRTDGQTLLHFDHGIYAHAQNVTIINNLFYNNNRGYHIQLADGASNWLVANNTFAFSTGNGEAGQIMFWGNNSGITICNNIFYNPNFSPLTRWSASVANSTFDHNLISGVSSIISDATGFTMGTNQIGPNPSFVNGSSAPYDFHLQSGSPAVDAGMNLAAVTNDLDGNARPQGASTDVGATEYSTGNNAPAISGVFVSPIAPDSVAINWTTAVPSTSYVEYGPGGYSNATPVDPNPATQHSVVLTGLTPSSSYHFRVGSAANGSLGISTDYTFTTPGGLSANVSAGSYSLSVAIPILSVMQGQSQNDIVMASLPTVDPNAVTFATSPLPTGIIASFSSVSCSAACTTQLAVSASPSAPVGIYSMSVTVSGGGVSSSASMTVRVTANLNQGASTGPDYDSYSLAYDPFSSN